MTPARGQRTVSTALRFLAGLIWIAGGVYNAVWTMRHLDLYQDFADSATLGVYRWLFGEVVLANPAFWTILLVIGEIGLGVLTLGRGNQARLGLALGAVWSLLLFPLLWPYTIMMGPYALLLAWLARSEHPTSLLHLVRSRVVRPDSGTTESTRGAHQGGYQ
jgi:hypothetical protein